MIPATGPRRRRIISFTVGSPWVVGHRHPNPPQIQGAFIMALTVVLLPLRLQPCCADL